MLRAGERCQGGPLLLGRESAVCQLTAPVSALAHTPCGRMGMHHHCRLQWDLLGHICLPDISFCLQHLCGHRGSQVFSGRGQQAAVHSGILSFGHLLLSIWASVQVASALLHAQGLEIVHPQSWLGRRRPFSRAVGGSDRCALSGPRSSPHFSSPHLIWHFHSQVRPGASSAFRCSFVVR